MRLIAPLFMLICARMVAQPAVSKVAFTESRHVIHAFSPAGDLTVPAVLVRLDISHASGKKDGGSLLVVYDPQGGHYFWIYSRANHPGDTASWLASLESGRVGVYAAPDGLLWVAMPGNLWVQQHTEQAKSLDAALQASIDAIQQGLPVFEGNGYATDTKDVAVARKIGTEFACPPLGDPAFSPMCGFGAKRIVSISRQGANWRVVVRNRWDQEVILDSNFNLVSTQRLASLK